MVIGESRNFPELAKVWHEDVVSVMMGAMSGAVAAAQARGEVRPRRSPALRVQPGGSGCCWACCGARCSTPDRGQAAGPEGPAGPARRGRSSRACPGQEACWSKGRGAHEAARFASSWPSSRSGWSGSSPGGSGGRARPHPRRLSGYVEGETLYVGRLGGRAGQHGVGPARPARRRRPAAVRPGRRPAGRRPRPGRVPGRRRRRLRRWTPRRGQRSDELAVYDAQRAAAAGPGGPGPGRLRPRRAAGRQGLLRSRPASTRPGRPCDTAQANVRTVERQRQGRDALGARPDAIRAAESQAAAARDQLALAQDRLDQISPSAPTAARVQDVFYQPGEWVAANQPVVALLADDRVRLRFFVPRAEVSLYRPGARIAFACDGCAGGAGGADQFRESPGRVHPAGDLQPRRPRPAGVPGRGPAGPSGRPDARPAGRRGPAGRQEGLGQVSAAAAKPAWSAGGRPGRRRARPEQVLRRQARGPGPVDPGGHGQDHRLPGPQRLGQDHHPADAVRPADARTPARARCWASTSGEHASEIKRQTGYMTQKFSLYEDLSIAREPGLHRPRLRPGPPARAGGRGAGAAGPDGAPRSSWPAACRAAGSSAWPWPPATLHEPRLLLLDEPTAGVDPKARREFWDEIHALSAEGLTVLVSTHYMDEAERCHDIAYIAYGRLIARGTAGRGDRPARASITFHAEGPGADRLARELSHGAGRRAMAAPFGAALHVSGHGPRGAGGRHRPLPPSRRSAGARSRPPWRTCSSS